MRRNIIGRRIPNPISNSASKSAFLLSSSPFSTSSGRGGGRGGGSPFSVADKFNSDARAPGKPEYDESKPVSPEPQRNGIGRGGGGGGDFSSFISALRTSKPGVGRGRGTDEPPRSRPPPPPPQPQSVPNQTQFEQNRPFRGQPQSEPNQTQFAHSSEQNLPFRGPPQSVPDRTQFAHSGEQNLPFRGPAQSIPNSGEHNVPFQGQPHQQRQPVPNQRQFEQNLQPRINLQPSGIDRGRSGAPLPQPQHTPRLTEENRHVRSPQRPNPGGEQPQARVEQPKLSREDAVKRAISILSKGDGEGAGGRGGGSGRGGGRRGRGGFEQRGRFDDDDESYGGLVLGDDADGERLAERLGVENMQKLMEGFEEMSDRILPSPEQDAYVDAMHTNYAIEFEPEYLMGEFDQNPDIDEKPPMPLRDMLEKVKPFIMAYEGIQSQEEWEEVVEETMKRVPLLKEIVDYYSGPDRVTAKKQNEELERVAKLIPPNAPPSLKQFTDRAALSLQSNPGWGFDKKCQYMDKLVREVNQCYP